MWCEPSWEACSCSETKERLDIAGAVCSVDSFLLKSVKRSPQTFRPKSWIAWGLGFFHPLAGFAAGPCAGGL